MFFYNMFFYICFFCIIYFIYFYYNKTKSEFFNNNYIDTKIFYNNCLELCNDNTFCKNFNIKKKNYNKCIKCNKKNYCFKKFNTNETICTPCIKGENYINNCNSIFNDACPNINDIYNFNGNKPYFKLIKDNNIYNPYNTKCLDCNFII